MLIEILFRRFGFHTRLLGTALVLAVLLWSAPAHAQSQAPPEVSFRITPVRPVAELRREALAAQPPAETGEFRDTELVELARVVPDVRLEIRHATSNNFLGTPVYEQARAFLQRPAAEALARVAWTLMREGYGLLVFDAYRPWYVRFPRVRSDGGAFDRGLRK
jgi:D-alanyl-D-alanine dipeptidase